MSEIDVNEKIRQFIMKRAGLYFKEYDMPSLREKIAERMQAAKCPTRWEYYNLLTQSPFAHKEFTELLNGLTIKHTHFFRNPDQFISLRDKALPEIMQHKARQGDLTLNILSVGCATGEEPYSIAMILLDVLGQAPLDRKPYLTWQASPWKIEVLATDISTEALVFAKRGIYPERAIQYVEKDFIKQYMERFCLIHKDKVFVSPAVKNLIEFQYMNLIDEFYPQGFDIIFCRNVTIYFEIETVKQVIEKFYQSLNEEGYLFTGGTETLFGISDKFEMVEIEHALIYKKIPAPVIAMRPKEIPLPVIARSAEGAPKQSQNEIASAPAAPRNDKDKPAVATPAKILKDANQLYEKAKIAFIKKDYTQAEKLARDALEIEPNLEQARILLANIFVNQDRFKEAERECQKAIDINFLSSQPRYLLGLIHKKKEEFKEALDNLRKAIYLNANFSLAHFTLAELYMEKAHTQEAEKAYKNTLRALEEEPEEDFRESSGGFSKKILAQVCVRGMKEMSNEKIKV